jgi:hypothetical protein
MHSGPDPAVAPAHYPADDTIVSVYIEGKLQQRAA